MRAFLIALVAVCCGLPTTGFTAPDLTPGVSRTYLFETAVGPNRTIEDGSAVEVELTTFLLADGTPALRYRTVPGARRYRSDLLTLLVLAFDLTPIEIRLSSDGHPIGLVDWSAQRVRLAEAVRQAGRDRDIDATAPARTIELGDEVVVMALLVDEVRLLALVQAEPGGAVDGSTCTRSVTNHLTRPASQQSLGIRDKAKSVATLSMIDGWVIGLEVEVQATLEDGTDEVIVYRFRRLNPPDPSNCPLGHS